VCELKHRHTFVCNPPLLFGV